MIELGWSGFYRCNKVFRKSLEGGKVNLGPQFQPEFGWAPSGQIGCGGPVWWSMAAGFLAARKLRDGQLKYKWLGTALVSKVRPL